MDVIAVLAAFFPIVIAFLLITVVYRNGRFTEILIIGLFSRLILAPLFPVIIGRVDVSDYFFFFDRFTGAIQSGRLIEYANIGSEAYILLFPGWIYYWFGADGFLLIRLINGLISLLVVIPANSLSRQIWGRDLANWQVALVIFWPAYAMLSVEVGMTAVSVFFAVSAVACLFVFVQNRTTISFLLVFISTALNTTFRIQYIFYVIMGVFVIYTYKLVTIENRKISIISALGSSGILTAGLVAYDQCIYPVLSLEKIIDRAQGIAHGGSAYLTSIYPQIYPDLIWYLPLHAYYFMFSPMPWNLLSIPNPLALVAAVQALAVLLLVLWSILRAREGIITDWRVLTLFCIVLLTSIGFGAVTKNAGAAARWRLPSVILLLTTTTSILAEKRKSTSNAES